MIQKMNMHCGASLVGRKNYLENLTLFWVKHEVEVSLPEPHLKKDTKNARKAKNKHVR